MTDPALRRSAWWWLRAAAIAITLYAAYQLFLVVRGWILMVLTVVLYFVFGLIVSFVAAPGVRLLERARVPKHAAILITLAGGVLLILGAGYLLGGPLVVEVRGISTTTAPKLIAQAQAYYSSTLAPQLEQHGIRINPLAELGGSVTGLGGRIAGLLLKGLQTTLQVALDLIVVLVVAFYLLSGGEELRNGFLSYLPAAAREYGEFAFDAIERVLGGYVRAQLFMALLIGLLAGAGCWLIGVPFPLLIGVAAGVFELVPIVGPFLGGALAVMVALTRSPVLAAEAVGVFLVIHVIEGYVLAPRIQGHFTRLHPLVAFLAIFAGIEIGGALGALFAVPLTALLFVFIRATVGDWRAQRPDLFKGSAGDPYLQRRRQRLLQEFRFRPADAWKELRRRAGLR